MLLAVPTTFSIELLDGLSRLNAEHAGQSGRIYELYGSFQSGLFGSARPAKYLPAPTRQQFVRHVREASARGIRFNYLLNAPCYGNHEYSAAGRDHLHETLSFLTDSGVASVTVAVPYLVHIIADAFPALEVVVSTIGYAGSLRGIEQYVEAGAARIVLDVEANRDFRFLARAVAHRPVPLEIIANPVCLHQCHYKFNHYCVAGHGSRQDSEEMSAGAPYNQFYLNWCFLQKLCNTGEFLKSPWLRPEDVHFWEAAGIRHFKIAGRGTDNDHILALCRAYLARRFSGNLLELLGWPHWNGFSRNPDGSRLPSLELYLENSRLEGFIEHFASKRAECRLGCTSCEYCTAWADRALRVNDGELLAAYVANMKRSLRQLVGQRPGPEDDRAILAHWRQCAAAQGVSG